MSTKTRALLVETASGPAEVEASAFWWYRENSTLYFVLETDRGVYEYQDPIDGVVGIRRQNGSHWTVSGDRDKSPVVFGQVSALTL